MLNKKVAKYFKIFLIVLGIISVLLLIWILADIGNAREFLENYDSYSNSGKNGFPKQLDFLISYTNATGDFTLMESTGISKEEGLAIMQQRNGTGPDPSTGSNPPNIPQDAQALRALILAAQGSDPGSSSSCDAVFKLLYPNTTNTYSSLYNWVDDGSTKKTIDDMNANMMSSVTVQVWKFKNFDPNSTSLEKESGTLSVYCCTSLHPIIKAIFAEIYADPSKPVIMTAGGHNVRYMNNKSTRNGGAKHTSTHSYGGTIDINDTIAGYRIDWNWNENNGDSKHPYPRSKSEWDKLPETQYKYVSIYQGCPIANAFKKYGLYPGVDWTIDNCDPMHFSIFNH